MPSQFNTGIQSLQSVESFNAIIKKSLNSTNLKAKYTTVGLSHLSSQFFFRWQLIFCLFDNSLSNTPDDNFKEDIVDKLQVMLKAILNDIDISNIVET
ncbi:hypothetical protein RhiirA5_431026 [Rhizophagus irregularis]|uniref:Uncharacterized protein n=1 Tax=Rhizophagus irregularis TaxID=588596 RepID=A0A2I1EJH1_9GLOM|nr:hypothetical protein RhiirA5_431026 [Rhizophagus irregularis]PKC68455.1 hypothetical protein RhiirA1_457173 [Rhizophagus irregularis]PKY22266.1 hypothetical protein RhiirB3_436158 [Rhizophagus irregularis]